MGSDFGFFAQLAAGYALGTLWMLWRTGRPRPPQEERPRRYFINPFLDD
jgi:uncharacterized membrane protein YedE/YeeE